MKMLKMLMMMVCAFGELQAMAADEFYTPAEDKQGLEKNKRVDADLPNVLIIGDSISIGYTKPVTELLAGTANVQRVKSNCGDTSKGRKQMDKWLGKTRWDVIHFNFGLHDLCYRHPDAKVYGNRDKVNGTQSVSLSQYEANLENILQTLEKNGAVLIWASTTLVPEGEAGRVVGDEVRYNRAAETIMNAHGIMIDDLYALTASFPPGMFRDPGDVHYTKAGYDELAEQVAGKISEALGKQHK